MSRTQHWLEYLPLGNFTRLVCATG